VSKYEAAINEAKAIVAVHASSVGLTMTARESAGVVIETLLTYGWTPPVVEDE
jgi:hypothetical protein